MVQTDAKLILPAYVYVTAYSRVTSIKNDEGKSLMAPNIITEWNNVVIYARKGWRYQRDNHNP